MFQAIMDGVEGTMSMNLENKERVTELHDMVMKGNWNGVVKVFKDVPDVQAAKMNRWGDTALHVAIDTTSEDIVEQLVRTIKATENDSSLRQDALSVKNDAGDTPLHAAAARGSQRLCCSIMNGQKSLMERNKRGETPVFLAAINGHGKAFRYLFDAVEEEDRFSCCRRLDGNTILHRTIGREQFDMALLILDHCEDISYYVNEKGESSLQILASIPSAFKSGIKLSWWEQPFFHLFTYVEEFEINTHVGKEIIVDIEHHPAETHENDACTALSSKFRSVRDKASRYRRGRQIMEKLLEKDIWYDASIAGDIWGLNEIQSSSQASSMITSEDIMSPSALLTATKHGATEVVDRILELKPYAIDDETSEKKNIVLVAIEARQTDILEKLMKHQSWREKRLKYAKDVHGNTALHLAAKLSVNPNMGFSTTYLQWEVSWFKYVQKMMPPSFMHERNNEGKTPEMVFAEQHDGMLEKSDKWVKEMSGNYIVAATLISGVTFATAYQIPGGYKSENGNSGGGMPQLMAGMPVIEPSNPAFRVFSISALVSFCFSITSLAAFLSIYSSRIEYRQYRRILPLKLCFGFLTLFVSIVSMLLSFCAAHVFELNPQNKSKCIPFYVTLALIPLSFYSTTQLPLYLDLLRASVFTVPPSRPFYMGPEQQPGEVEEERKWEEEEPQQQDQTGRTKRHRRIRRWKSVKKLGSDTADVKHI